MGIEIRPHLKRKEFSKHWEIPSQDIASLFIKEVIVDTLTATEKQELETIIPWQFMVEWNNRVAKSTWDVVTVLSRAENLAVKELEKQNG